MSVSRAYCACRLLPWVTVALATTLSGCAAKVATRSFQVVATPHANKDSPVPVDLVLIKAGPLVPMVANLSAKQWFQERSQLLRDHPGQIEYRSWQFVPGQVVDVRHLPFANRKGVALFVFADYLSEGVHRLRVDPMKKFRLILNADGFQAETIS